MEALRLQEAQPHNDNVIVHTLTMPKRKRTIAPVKVTPIDNRKVILTGALNEYIYDQLLESSILAPLIQGTLPFGTLAKEVYWNAMGDPNDRFISVDMKKKYFYSNLRDAISVYRKALA